MGLCTDGVHRRSTKLARVFAAVSHTWQSSKRATTLCSSSRLDVHKGLDRNVKDGRHRLGDSGHFEGKCINHRDRAQGNAILWGTTSHGAGSGEWRQKRYASLRQRNSSTPQKLRQEAGCRDSSSCSKRHSVTRNPVSQLLASPIESQNDAEFKRFPSAGVYPRFPEHVSWLKFGGLVARFRSTRVEIRRRCG